MKYRPSGIPEGLWDSSIGVGKIYSMVNVPEPVSPCHPPMRM